MIPMARAYIALGSNLGDREENLRRAVGELRALGEDLRASGLYETAPVGPEDQPWFLNAVVSLETEIWPRRLVRELKAIERRLGRREAARFGPRAVDLDLLLYDEVELDIPSVSLPHPRLHLRRFVLEPLVELDPQARHPTLDRTAGELLETLQDEHQVRPFKDASWLEPEG